jgi:hypothetical protein
MGVGVIAIILNFGASLSFPDVYSTTFLTSILRKILLHPYPYWAIIVLSGVGTFLSVFFGDEVMDVISASRQDSEQKSRHFKLRAVSMIIIFTLTFFAYEHLLVGLGIDISS